MEARSPKKEKRKFKQTKQLVRLALNDGWSQTEIANKCRTHQSIVSKWSKGETLATEQQLQPLLEVYGHKLRRNSFRVYWNIDPETQQKSYFKVEGKVILSQAFYDARRVKHQIVKKVPMMKLVIHHQGDNKFRVVIQSRLTFLNSSSELESTVEDAIWGSDISEQYELAELLKIIDKYAESLLSEYPSDANTLPFITRQALLHHGFSINGIVEYPAVW
ncbi:multiprotein-bridging factor 1 family protein [Arsukibacterium sp.]|uniref:helix-turn-helix domain-containing protein n=1 Tax=Arsukibacterium sp. TaxID=1977258 RepID=UPI00356339EF